MATRPDTLHCVTCQQALPEGKEPEYFGQVSTGYSPEGEVERAAEDVSSFLKYAKTINSAVWDMLQVAALDSPDSRRKNITSMRPSRSAFSLSTWLEKPSGESTR